MKTGVSRITLVEDNAVLLRSLVETLAGIGDLKVVGAHLSAESALAAGWKDTDLLLTDLELPGIPGQELIAAALASKPGLIGVALTIHDNRDSLFAALAAGATGYVLKGLSVAELAEAIRAAARGESPISPAVARHLITEFGSWTPTAAEETLSARERELLAMLGEGASYKEAAQRLGLSAHTIHSHVKNIYGKLQAKTRAQALQRARARGLLDG